MSDSASADAFTATADPLESGPTPGPAFAPQAHREFVPDTGLVPEPKPVPESHILIFINLHNIIVIEENSWNMTLKHDTIYVKSKDI